MSDPRANRDAYLASVSARLGLPPDHERDVLEELEGHLTESAAGLVEEGLSPELAERESIARLGDPGELADGIRRARQSRRRLLAAAGAGVTAAVGGVVWGYLLASALAMVAGVLAAVAVTTVLGWLSLSNSGWASSAQAFSIPIALFVPGCVGYRLVTAVAARSARRAVTLRRPIAIAGGGILAGGGGARLRGRPVGGRPRCGRAVHERRIRVVPSLTRSRHVEGTALVPHGSDRSRSGRRALSPDRTRRVGGLPAVDRHRLGVVRDAVVGQSRPTAASDSHAAR